MFRTRKQEADEFYEAITPPALNRDEANVMRQVLAGMLWSKQFYYYDVDRWLEDTGPAHTSRIERRPRVMSTGITCSTAT